MPAADARSRFFFVLQKLGHLAPQGDLPATPIPVDLCKLRSVPFDILYLVT